MITREARNALSEMAAQLEALPRPLTFAAELKAFLQVTAAGEIIKQLHTSDLADPVIDRLLVAIANIETFASGGKA